jgi:ABC-2 type transport system permease protein
MTAVDVAVTTDSFGASLGRVRAAARHDLRILKSDPAFLLIFTIMPIAFMAFSLKTAKYALAVEFPGRGLNGAAFIVPGATVLFSGFLVGNIGFGIFREHGWGTWERLRSSPLSPAELMLGKSLVPMLSIGIQLAALLGGERSCSACRSGGRWRASSPSPWPSPPWRWPSGSCSCRSAGR